MKRPAVSGLPVPGERRPAMVAAVVTAGAAAVVAGATVVAWSARESGAVVALVVAVVALAAGCGALGGYLLWLRRAVTTRMAGLLRPYLAPAAPTPVEHLRPAVPVPARPERRPVAVEAS